MKQKILAAVCALALCAALVPAGFAEQAAADTAMRQAMGLPIDN